MAGKVEEAGHEAVHDAGLEEAAAVGRVAGLEEAGHAAGVQENGLDDEGRMRLGRRTEAFRDMVGIRNRWYTGHEMRCTWDEDHPEIRIFGNYWEVIRSWSHFELVVARVEQESGFQT